MGREERDDETHLEEVAREAEKSGLGNRANTERSDTIPGQTQPGQGQPEKQKKKENTARPSRGRRTCR